MRKSVLIVFFLAFWLGVFCQVSSQEALNFASQKGFLIGSETAEILPNAQITHSKEPYWVVAVMYGESLNVLIPIKAKDKAEVPADEASRRALIKTGFVLRSYASFKDSLVKQDKWLFTSANVSFLNQLAVDLGNEHFDLETVKSELNKHPDLQGSLAIQDDIIDVQNNLDKLKVGIQAAGKAIDSAREWEAPYLNKPDTNSIDNLEKNFDSATQKIALLQAQKNDYLTALEKVRQEIAQTDLPIDTKKSLQNLLDYPASLQRIAGIITYGTSFEESLQGIFDNVRVKREDLLKSLASRIERNNAYQILFGESQLLIERTNGRYSTLQEAADSILDPEVELLWKEENELQLLRESWKSAQSYYNSQQYSLAIQAGGKAMNSAVRVFKGGFKSQNPPPGPDTNLLITGIIVLVVIIIIIYALRNRGKLMSLVSPQEVENDEYKY